MKEIIEALNLPKQILEKSEKLLSTLFGEAFKEIGGMFGDQMRAKRMINQFKILNRTTEILEKKGLNPHQINLKALVPLIEKSSLEEDKQLQEKWATLLANISSTPENGLEPRLINTLSRLSSLEAGILDFIHDYYLRTREHLFQNSRDKYQTEKEIKPKQVTLSISNIKTKFKLTDDFTSIYIENLEGLSLIQFEDPEIEIDDFFAEGSIVKKGNIKEKVDLDLNLSAEYQRSNKFYLSAYGLYFISQCKPE
jgi:hypothetical protein